MFLGELRGHNGWITSIVTSPENPDTVLSASRDKSVIMWKLNQTHSADEKIGTPVRRLVGHSHYVQDLALSSDGAHCLTGSWDSTLRLWNLSTGKTTHRFVSHTKDVLSVAFSADNRQVMSGGRDRQVKLWNVLGECKHTFDDKAHEDWVSCVRFSPNPAAPVAVSAGWDKVVKVWSVADMSLKANLMGHTGYINSVTVSPDGSLCASGGKDGSAMLWDLNDAKELSILEAGDVINALCFSPVRYWLCAATASSIKIWDLESKQVTAELKPDFGSERSAKAVPIQCTSLAWSSDGRILFAGYTDNIIRAWQVRD